MAPRTPQTTVVAVEPTAEERVVYDTCERLVAASPDVVDEVAAHLSTLVLATPSSLRSVMNNIKNASKMNYLKAITHMCAAGAVAEPFLVGEMAELLALTNGKGKGVPAAATAAVTALVNMLSAYSLQLVMPAILASMRIENNWKVRVAGFNAMTAFATKGPQIVGALLPEIIPELEEHLFDTKAQVKAGAIECLTACMSVVDNPDIAPVVPELVASMVDHEQATETVHRLAATTFVKSVTVGTLAIAAPLLVRGLKARVTAVRRQTAVIISNMSKLVDDPHDAAPFLPKLLPLIEIAADSVSNPEARAVCEKVFEQLKRLDDKVRTTTPKTMSSEDMLVKLRTHVVSASEVMAEMMYVLSVVCSALVLTKNFETPAWRSVVVPFLAPYVEEAQRVVDQILSDVVLSVLGDEVEEEEGAEELCNCNFTLAYGTKILLHNTSMRLNRGYKYGLLGGNDSGKTTLMRAIANGQVDGFPPLDEVKTVFVEADIIGELSDLTCVEYVLADERIAASGATAEDVARTLGTVGFNEAMRFGPVNTLSGGWRMKLAMARAMLQNADILLMDEPTNHLDVMNVAWVKDYLNRLTNVTCIMVSHDSGLLNDVCTHIIQIQDLKLNVHKGNLSAFVEKVPSAASFFELSQTKLSFTFPQPGPLEGVKSKGKALMKMQNVTFTYPTASAPQISNVTVQVSLSSRVACLGANGAGKSTAIKLLTGEMEPDSGEVWKHPNCRVAYVAQHAFHHIEKHLNKTPNEYIRWRYENEEDKEALKKVTMVATPEEEVLMKTPFEHIEKNEETGAQKKTRRVIDDLTGARRASKSKTNEYEVKFQGYDIIYNEFMSEDKLRRMGWTKPMQIIDARIAARAGMYVRPLTTSHVESHLEDVGLDREFGTHTRLAALSGGQKVKVVIAAAMWNQPHVLILDEPTNYLDRESLGALSNAIRVFDGGVVMITHNNEFCSSLCPETWVVENGRLDCQGDPEWMATAQKTAVEFTQMEEMVDGAGNVSKVKQAKKVLSRKEQKAKAKRRANAIKNGEPYSDSEEDE